MRAGLMVAAAVVCATALLGGCGDKAAGAGNAVKKSDAKAWDGPANGAVHGAEGFKAGDKTAWEAQVKARTERGQNEYTRTTSGKK